MPELRPYHPGDEQGICDLFAACHARPLPLDLWRWRYSPQGGHSPVINVAVDAGRVVAHIGALPTTLRRGTQTINAGLWVDLMVHPDYRNLSLFLDMAEANHAQCAQNGVRLVFAFPNDRSYPVLKRMLGWKPVEEIDALEAPLQGLRPVPGGTQTEPLNQFSDPHEQLARRLAPADAFAAERTADWLNWRYRQRPGRTYAAWNARNSRGELSGWIAAHIFDGPQGRIGDILDLYAEPEAGDALWSAALAHFKAHDVQTVSCWALKESPLFARALGWGLTPSGPRTHFAGRWTLSNETASFPAQGRDWRISKGDSDVF